MIERDGTVVECRPSEAVGSHCPGNNHDSIGVCLAGDTGHTAEQLAAAVEHCARLQVAFGPLEVRGHTELQRFRWRELRCPAAIDMDDFRRLVADHLAGMELRAPMQTTEPPEDKLTPQQQLILDYLRSGRSISTVVAIVSLGIMSISSRIAELRKRGYDIAEEWAVDHHERRYLKYRLGAEEGAPG